MIKSIMVTRLSLSNWSLKKTLSIVPDGIDQAKIKIFCFLFFLNLVKIVALLPQHLKDKQSGQILLDAIAFFISLSVIKLLLSRPGWLKGLIHFALISTIEYILIFVYLYGAGTDILMLQQVFMAIMCSYYGLNKRWGLIYSSLVIVPVLITVLAGHGVNSFTIRERFSSPAYFLTALLNFIAIIVSHYYFQNALYNIIEEKKKLNIQLQRSLNAKSTFLSTMSHELRTPLNSVIGMANILLTDQVNKEQKESLDILKFSAENLLSLINNVLDFNKIDSDKIELESVPFNLAELLENVHSNFRIKAVEQGLACTLYIDPEIEGRRFIGDPTRLTQILFNLMSNATKFTSQGSVEISTSITHKNKDRLTIRFSVKDTGIGIGPEKHALIFDPFTQASKNTTRKFGGTGLGLSIVKHLLLLYNSSIHIESKVNQGTNFYFDIDFQIFPENPGTIKPAVHAEKISLGNLRLLLAEDNQMNILFMQKLLSKWEIIPVIAKNGRQVIDSLRDRTFDVILMDLHMPEMNGFEATAYIRRLDDPERSGIYIIALTASVSDGISSKIKEYGMNDYMNKPFNPAELKRKLERLVNNGNKLTP